MTGGGGFLGSAIARALAARGDEVRSLARGSYPELAAAGISALRGDVADPAAAAAACAGMDAVVHVAAKVGLWGPAGEFERVNVRGTENVLAACRRAGVRRLVFTSSPSVVFDGRDAEGIDESAPYPAVYDSEYSRTKAAAERLVLAANGPGLAAIALRPHLVWGPGDNHLIPRILARGRAGTLRRIGSHDKLVDTTLVADAAQAHLLALERLAAGPAAGGRAYFISSGDPRPIWEIVNGILAAAGLPPVTRSVPPALARAAAAILETVHAALRLPGEPRLTRFLVAQLSTAHWFDISAARRDLGYRPSRSVAEGLKLLAAVGPLAQAPKA